MNNKIISKRCWDEWQKTAAINNKIINKLLSLICIISIVSFCGCGEKHSSMNEHSSTNEHSSITEQLIGSTYQNTITYHGRQYLAIGQVTNKNGVYSFNTKYDGMMYIVGDFVLQPYNNP